MTNLLADTQYFHANLLSGVEFAADVLPDRDTVTLVFRMLTGVADDPPDLTGVGMIVERTLSKGTANYDGRALADAFDRLGAQWSGVAGRQSTVLRVLCLPEYVEQSLELVVEMLQRPTFPDEAVRVAVDLAQQDLKHMEDDPQDLVRLMIQRLTLGPVYGRYAGGEPETLARITPAAVRQRWEHTYAAGRLQVAAAGPIDVVRLGQLIDEAFAGFGSAEPAGRDLVQMPFSSGWVHRHKELKQQYMSLTLPGLRRDDPRYWVEQVMLGVLSGGMSGRLFTEVREKQGLVYWVGAWNENPRGWGILHVGASTTPERCELTYRTLLRELERIGEDLTDAEMHRARNQLIAQMQTESDLTRARAGGISDDLFHFGRPFGPEPKVAALRAVTTQDVLDYARQLPRQTLCIATLGPRDLQSLPGGPPLLT